MRAPEQETKQVPSALIQKFRVKINIAAYGGVAGVLASLWGFYSPNYQLKANKISYISMYIFAMWNVRSK